MGGESSCNRRDDSNGRQCRRFFLPLVSSLKDDRNRSPHNRHWVFHHLLGRPSPRGESPRRVYLLPFPLRQMSSKALILFMYLVAVYLVIHRWYKNGGQGMPYPTTITAPSYLYGALALTSDFTGGLTTVLAVGLTFGLYQRIKSNAGVPFVASNVPPVGPKGPAGPKGSGNATGATNKPPVGPKGPR